MQILLILGIGFAAIAVLFALQNNVPVTVNFFAWSFDGSLAMVLLITLGLGAIVAGLVSSPTVIRGQWTASRLKRQVATLEEKNGSLQQRVTELEKQLESARAAQAPTEPAAPVEDKPYVGLKTLLTGATDTPKS